MARSAEQKRLDNLHRHPDGEYGERPRGVAPEVDVGGPGEFDPSLWEPERVWARIDTLTGERLRLDPARTVKVPAVNETDKLYTAHNKFVAYVGKTSQMGDMPPERVAGLLGGTLAPSQTVALPPEFLGRNPDANAVLLEAFAAKPGTRFIVLDGERPRVVAVTGGFGKTGTFGRPWLVVENGAETLVARQFQAEFLEAHPEYATPEGRAQVESLFRRMADPRCRGKRFAYMWDEAPVEPRLVLAAAQGHGTQMLPGDVDGMLAAAGVGRGGYEMEWIRAGIEKLPTAVGTMSGPGGVTHPEVRVMRAGPFSEYLYPDKVAAELGGTSRRSRDAALNRAYRGFLLDKFDAEEARERQADYVREAATSSATVYQEKRHIPESHRRAAAASRFVSSGDFRELEVDESVDLARLDAVTDDYMALRQILPVTTRAALRFRKTGRHNATGVYHPHADNIAVDPDSPGSFVHEWAHHIDWTAGERPLSSGAPWVRDAVKALRADPDASRLAQRRPMSYWETPTEIVARSGEMYLEWRGVQTSLNKPEEGHSGPQYRSLEGLKPQIMAFWDEVFAEHGGRASS